MAAIEPRTVPVQARRGRTAPAQPVEEAAVADGGPENITQIRDILFGRQMAEYDSRFAEIEDAVAAATSAIRAEFGERLEALEARINERIESVADDLRGERAVAIKGEEEQLEAARKSLEKALKKLSDALDARASTLDDAISASANTLRGEFAAQSESDRGRLAALLGEVATQLKASENAGSVAAET